MSVGATVAGRLDAMCVYPALERTGHHHVLKLHAVHEAAMQDFPADAHRTAGQQQRHARAVGDAAVTRQDLQPLPGRRQPFERAGAGVPREQGGGVDIENGSLLVDRHGVSLRTGLRRRFRGRNDQRYGPTLILRAVFWLLMYRTVPNTGRSGAHGRS